MQIFHDGDVSLHDVIHAHHRRNHTSSPSVQNHHPPRVPGNPPCPVASSIHTDDIGQQHRANSFTERFFHTSGCTGPSVLASRQRPNNRSEAIEWSCWSHRRVYWTRSSIGYDHYYYSLDIEENRKYTSTATEIMWGIPGNGNKIATCCLTVQTPAC